MVDATTSAESFEHTCDPRPDLLGIGDELAGARLDRFGSEVGDDAPLVVANENLCDSRACGLERTSEPASQPRLKNSVERESFGKPGREPRRRLGFGVLPTPLRASLPTRDRAEPARRDRRGGGCCSQHG